MINIRAGKNCFLTFCINKNRYFNNKIDFFVSLLFTIFTMLGNYFSPQAIKLWKNANVVFNILAFFVFIVFYYFCIQGIKKLSKNIIILLEKIPTRLLVIILLIRWAVYLILCYPGSVPADGFTMLGQLQGMFTLSNDHPFFATLLQGMIFKFGRIVGDNNFGIALFLWIQTFFMFFCVLKTTQFLKKRNFTNGSINLILLLFIICPIFAVFTQYYRKDVLFGCFLYMYLLYYSDIMLSYECRSYRDKLHKRDFIMLTWGILACLYRHNGIFIVAISLIIRFIYDKRWKNSLLIILLFFIYFFANNFLYPKLGVMSVGKERTFMYANSLRFMQTGRYIKKHGKEVSENELKKIGSVLDVDKLISNYNTLSIDAFMASVKRGGMANKKQYDEVWLKQFKNDPLVYCTAIYNFVYLYTYPYEAQNHSIFNISESNQKFKKFNVYRTERTNEIVNDIRTVYDKMTKIVFLVPFFTPALYFWIIIYCSVRLIRKRFRYFIAISPVLIGLIICLMGFLPVNGGLHYAFPTIFAYPLVIAIVIDSTNYVGVKNK